MTGESLLLTGATGLIGGDVLGLLSAHARPSTRIIVLRRPGARPAFAPTTRVTELSGDLSQPELGLTPDRWSELQSELTAILHCGAATRFSVTRDEARSVNVEGTERLIALARGAPRVRRFGFVSTAFVAGRRTGAITEQQLEHDAGFVNDYEWSKYEAERVVRSSGLPWSIYRLSAVVGNSQTGRVRQYNGIHQAMRVYCTQLLSFIPGWADSPVDLIPDDFAGGAIHELFEHFEPETTYHLCSGPDKALPLARLLEIVIDAGNRVRRASGLPAVGLPEIVGRAAFDGLRQAAPERCGGQGRAVNAMGSFLPQLLYPKRFERDETDRALDGSQFAAPPMDSHIGRVVEFCASHRWGRAEC